MDISTGEPLPGASVFILNSPLGTTTGNNGEFSIGGIHDPRITLVVSYIGYNPDSIAYDLTSQKRSGIVVNLNPSAQELSQVKIEAESQGQVKAFILQKDAPSITNIISSEQIQQFPDMSAADALQRIPGITLQRDQGEGRFVQLRGTPAEMTTLNINGEQVPSPESGVRYIGMDIIAADQIDRIEITKMLTPDMDADAIAGNVNIITRRAKTFNPEINATLSAGYNNLRGTGNYNLQFSYGQRIGKFGFYMNGSQFTNVYGSDNMEFKYVKSAIWTNQGEEEDNYVVRYREFQLSHYDITRKRTGISATLDFEFSDYSFIFLRGMFNSFVDDEVRYRKVYTLDDPLTENYFLYGGIEHDMKDRVKNQGLNTINFGGEYRKGLFKINYETAYAVASENTPNRVFGRFENPGQALAIKFDYTDPDWPKPYFPNEEDEAVAYNYAGYEFDRLSIKQENVSDKNITARFDLEFQYHSNGPERGIIKTGGKIRFKHKYQDINAMVLGAYNTTNPLYPGEAPPLTLPSVSDGFANTDLLNEGYVVEYVPDAEKLQHHYEFYPWFFIMSRDNLREETIMQDYNANEDIYSAYIMLRHDFKKWMILSGLRYENTYIYYAGRRAIYHPVTQKFIDADTIPESNTYEFLVPYFQLKIKLSEKTNLLTGINYTFARPSFEDIIPTYEGNEDGDFTLGNPGLEFPRSLNIDLAIEKYIQGDGILSSTFFYKNIENFISKYSTHAHFDSLFETSGFINTSINGIRSYVYGGELQSQFNFNFLRGFFSDFGIYFNYTFTFSDAQIPKRKPANYSDFVFDPTQPFEEQFTEEGIENITLPGQSRHAANIALFYESKSVYVKIAANYHDTFLYELGTDKDLDIYYNEALHLDLTADYKFNRHTRIFLDMVNLTNQPLVFYLSRPGQISKKEYYSWTARIGLKLSF